MAEPKWVGSFFGTLGSSSGYHLVIDNRLQSGVKYYYWPTLNKLALQENENYKWTPLVVLEVTDRFTQDEIRAYGKIIVDRLNAHEVEKKLGGGE